MNFNDYDNNVKTWVGQVLATRTVNTDLTKKSCKKILSLGKKDRDSKLLGFAYYYLAESYFFENEYNKFIKNLILGIKHQQEIQMGSLLARSYNMLGINSDIHGNVPSAIDYFLTSLEYCQKYGLNYEAGHANSNIGQIYGMLHEYKTAISYLKKSITCFNKGKDNQFYSRNLLIIETNIGTNYFRLGDMASALKYFYKIERERNKYLDETYNQMTLFIFEVIFLNALEEYEKRDELIGKLLVLIDEIPSLMDMYDDVFMFCEFLLEAKRYEELWVLIVRMETLTKQAGITNIHLRVLRFKIQYYRALNDEPSYLHTSAEYFLLTEQQESENITMAKESIELRMDLERVKEKQTLIQEENKILLEKSEKDSLTKLPNRYKLNDYSEIAFDRALKNGTTLAIEIFDIDCFKQYNDTYGHQSGDECLMKIAQLLHSLMEDGLFCARYGGDEFMIIYENMTDEDILQISRKLQNDVIALNLKQKNSTVYPVVTISQGIRNSVPKNINKIWDYLYVADAALYQVKRAKKNNICLLHRMVVKIDSDNTIMVETR